MWMRKQHEEKCLFYFCSFIPASPRVPQHSWQARRAACQGGDGVAGAGVPMETLQKSPVPAMDRVPMSLSLPRTHTGLCSASSKEQSAATGLGWGAGCIPLHGAGAGTRPQRSQLHPPGCGVAGTSGRDLTGEGSHGGGTTGTARGHGGGTAPDLRDTTSPAKTAVSPGSAQHPAAGSGLLAQSSPLPASLPAAPAAPARS